MNMSFSEKTAGAVCKRLLKGNSKRGADLAFGWFDDTGLQCFTDGYRAFRFKSHLSDLSCKDKHSAASALARVFAPLDAGSLVEMPAPDASELKACLAAHKRKGEPIRAPYDPGDEFPTINAQFALDALRVFPGAVWYVLSELPKRIISPVFLLHENGSACILPIYDREKLDRIKAAQQPTTEPVQEPTAAPSEDKTAPNSPTDLNYFIYAKLPGDKSFSLADPARGKYRLGRFYAPRFAEKDLDRLQEFLDLAAASIPGAIFQIRRLDGRRTIYTASPTYSPELFAETFAA